MSYASSEASVAAGQPVGLIDLACGSAAWRYTSAAVDVTYGGNTYTHQPGMTIGKVEHSRNILLSMLEIEVPWSCVFVKLYPSAIPEGRVTVVYTRGHAPDYEVQFRGFVSHVQRKSGRKAVIACTASAHEAGHAGICLRPGKLCGVPLYHPLCGVVKADYTSSGTVAAVDGFTVTATLFETHADGYWVGGEFTCGGVTRMIVSHTGDTVILSHSIGSLAVGASFTATAGCDGTHPTCEDRFGNLANQKAYRFMSNRNPFVEGVL